jgi:hypothetical protein
MKLLMGLDHKMYYDLYFMLSINYGPDGFFTDTKAARGKYVEFTPYNKGNLWKLRYFYNGHFRVFFGTKEIAYCTTLKDCLPFIQPKKR